MDSCISFSRRCVDPLHIPHAHKNQLLMPCLSRWFELLLCCAHWKSRRVRWRRLQAGCGKRFRCHVRKCVLPTPGLASFAGRLVSSRKRAAWATQALSTHLGIREVEKRRGHIKGTGNMREILLNKCLPPTLLVLLALLVLPAVSRCAPPAAGAGLRLGHLGFWGVAFLRLGLRGLGTRALDTGAGGVEPLAQRLQVVQLLALVGGVRQALQATSATVRVG
mmetsp:Transcript_10916/g.31006  ORF Transcript_10916/g.31006 Transcript_10916/m.31006 type:complete len:221 (+) Transcript_10916:1546-2208(+)